MSSNNQNPQKIPITDPQHLIDMGITLGLVTALRAIEDIAEGERLTGVGISRYAVKAVEAEHRVQVMQRNIRLAVSHGIDLDKNNILWEGRPEIIVEPKDLVEQASGQ